MQQPCDREEAAERGECGAQQERPDQVVADAAVAHDLVSLVEPSAGDDRNAHEERDARRRVSGQPEPTAHGDRDSRARDTGLQSKCLRDAHRGGVFDVESLHFTALATLIRPPQDQPERYEHRPDQHRIAQVVLDPVVEQRSRDRARHG